MRLMPKITLAAAIFIAAPTASYSQSAYDYPWCALYGTRTGGQGCYFATYQQCMETISGIGGSCIRSPYYHGAPTTPWRRRGYWGD